MTFQPIYRASELLLSIPQSKRSMVTDHSSTSTFHTATQESMTEADLEDREQDLLVAARSYADAKEFLRAAHLLVDCQSAKAKFMRVYNEFLVCCFFLS